MQQTKAGLPYYDDNPCDFEQWHFVVMGKHDPVPRRQAVQNSTGRREVPHPVDPVPGRRLAHHVYDPGTGRQTLKDDLVPGHLGRSPLIIDDEDDEAELMRQYTGQRLISVWNEGMQVRVVDDELDPEFCYAEWLVARNDSVSVDISTHAVAEPEMDDGLALEESKTIVLVVAWILWYMEVFLPSTERCENSGESRSGLATAKLRSFEFTTPMSYYAIDSCPSVGDGSGTIQLRQWTCTFHVASPLIRRCVASRPPQRRQGATPDFTSSSLLQQCFLGAPAVVRMQVWLLMTVRQHEDAKEPGETCSTGGNVTPPSILASDLMLYWRCADGDGLRFRVSGSCGREGTLMGDTSWSEPLPADEPLDEADE